MSMNLCADTPFIPQDDGDVVFSAPWEARAFAMVVKLHQSGLFTWPEWVEVFSTEVAKAENGEHARAGHTDDYYEIWLRAFEKLLVKLEIVSPESMEQEVAHTLANWPHPAHIANRAPIAIEPAAD